MKNFSKQLAKIERKLFAEVERGGYTTDEKSYHMSIRNGFIEQHIECFDENDDIVIITQEIEMIDGELTALGTQYQY